MKNIIYYFSGTGNSLTVARGIAEELDDTRLEMIGTEPAAVDADCESVGFVYPVYYFSLPTIVKRFVEAMNLKNVTYVYGVATYGGFSGTSYKQLQQSVGKGGGRLSAVYGVLMPGNYIVKYSAFPKIYQNFALKRSGRKTAAIAGRIKAHQVTDIPQGNAMARRTEEGNLKIIAGFGGMGEHFMATDACTGCGICEKVCPVRNIKLSPENQKPVWGRQCEQCVACIQWCPVRAIDYADITVKRKRYHHPEVKAADLFRD